MTRFFRWTPLVLACALIQGLGCKQAAKESGPELSKVKFKVGPTTLTMLQVGGLSQSTCSGCAAYESGEYEIYISQSRAGETPESLEKAVEAYQQELRASPSGVTQRKLEDGLLVSGPRLVMVWRKIGSFSTFLCRARAKSDGDAKKQALMEKMCVSLENPYAKRRRR